MIDLGSTEDIHRLYAAIKQSEQALSPYRKSRGEMVREFVGSHYGETDLRRHAVIANGLAQTVETYATALSFDDPKSRVTSTVRELRPYAARWSYSLDSLTRKIQFVETFQKMVIDAFFLMGVGMVYRKGSGLIELADEEFVDPGMPYLDHISNDDFVLDMSVKDVRRCRFMANHYRLPWQRVQKDSNLKKSVIEECSATSNRESGEPRANDITTAGYIENDIYEEMIDLWNVWIPENNQIAVFPAYVETKPLLVVDETENPYQILSFLDVPDNLIPLAPAMNLMELHWLYQGLLRKTARQAQQQKNFFVYRPTNEKDADRQRKARDSEWVKSMDPTATVRVSHPGADPGSVAFSLNVFELFNRQAGNLEAAAGLGVQAPTATQEGLIDERVGRREGMMLNRAQRCASDCLRALARHMWEDKTLEVRAVRPGVRGMRTEFDASWSPGDRSGDFADYEFVVVPYSMTYESPQARVSKIDKFAQAAVSLAPLIQQQGGTIDCREILRQYADALNFPEGDDIVQFTGAPNGGEGEAPGMQPETTRNYVRRNVPTGGTPQNQRTMLQQALLGGGQNGAQQTAMQEQ